MNKTLKILLVIITGILMTCAAIWVLGTTATSAEQAMSTGELVGVSLAILLLVLIGLAIYKRAGKEHRLAGVSQGRDPGDDARGPARSSLWTWLLGGIVILLVAGGVLIYRQGRTVPQIEQAGAIPTPSVEPGEGQVDNSTSTFGLLGELQGYPAAIWNIAFSPDGALLAAGGSRRAVVVWDLTTLKSEYYLEPAELGVITGLDFSTDGSRLIAGGNAEFWYWDTDVPSSTTHGKAPGLTTMSSIFHITGTGGKAAFADAFGNIALIEIDADSTSTNVIQLDNDGAASSAALAFHPDGSILFSGSDKKIAQWDTKTGEQLGSFSVEDSITDLALNSQGTFLAIGLGNSEAETGVIQFWDIKTGSMTAALDPQKGSTKSLALSPDGTLLAVGSTTGMIYLWDMESQKKLAEFEGPTGFGRSLAFSPDSALLASGGDDGMVRLWKIGREIPSQVALMPAAGAMAEEPSASAGPLPTYSDVVAAYPAGSALCSTQAVLKGIEANNSWLLDGEVAFVDNKMMVKCYGTKITLGIEAEIDGKIYQPGTLLTVDQNLEWIEVSSWD